MVIEKIDVLAKKAGEDSTLLSNLRAKNRERNKPLPVESD